VCNTAIAGSEGLELGGDVGLLDGADVGAGVVGWHLKRQFEFALHLQPEMLMQFVFFLLAQRCRQTIYDCGVGESVGKAVGGITGEKVGLLEGKTVGAKLGDMDGSSVGFTEG
jgi:hypothetical protein